MSQFGVCAFDWSIWQHMLFRRQAIMVYSEFRGSHPQYMANTQQDVVNISSIFAYDVSGALLPIFLCKRERSFPHFQRWKQLKVRLKLLNGWLFRQVFQQKRWKTGLSRMKTSPAKLKTMLKPWKTYSGNSLDFTAPCYEKNAEIWRKSAFTPWQSRIHMI